MTRKLTPEEERLWKETVGELPPKKRPASPVGTMPAPSAKPKETKTAPALLKPLDTRTAKATLFKRHTKPDASIDLHGKTENEAFVALQQFLAKNPYAQHVRIITGKGRHGQGALRRLVPLWLDQSPWRDRISTIAHAPENKGGEGVLHVLLKKPRHER